MERDKFIDNFTTTFIATCLANKYTTEGKNTVADDKLFNDANALAFEAWEKFNNNIPCCQDVLTFNRDEYNNDRMRRLPKNKKLTYRGDGVTIDYDPDSRQPSHCDYNQAREVIRQAKLKGLTHIHWACSSAMAKELEEDGYTIHNDKNRTISWKK